MRCLLAGLLALWPAALAFSQARGHVESIGFGGDFRPGCWTPMVVYLVPTTGSPFVGRIEVIQEDVDRDIVRFTRQINFTGNPAGGGTSEARFWMYFIPQSSRGKGRGIDGTQSKDELTEIIKVRLCTDSGKELVKLPITQTLTPLEFSRNDNRGQKAVLCVHKEHVPNLMEYKTMMGLKEDIRAIPLREVAFGLPDDVIGYDGIDAILWTDANPMELQDQQIKAIEDFVKRGGRLVISQDTTANQWQRNNVRFASLMPVMVTGIEDRKDAATLIRLAKLSKNTDPIRVWERISDLKIAIGMPKSDAHIIEKEVADITPTTLPIEKAPETRPAQGDGPSKGKLPYIVRRPFGSGSVTWVAQDLGERKLLGAGRATEGWVHIWDRVFDWPNEPILAQNATQTDKDMYGPNATVDAGKGLLKYMDLPSTSAALVGIAVLFFLIYWAVAGPGSFWALSSRGRSHLSWFTFGAIAIGATALTYLIVKLVLRGDPQLQHITYVRITPGEPASVRSNIGLYIPRDGLQKIELKDAAPGKSTHITAFPLHPAYVSDDSQFLNRQEYSIPVREVVEGERPAQSPRVVQVPYRSTLKKFQASWTGNLPGGLDGSVKLHSEIPYLRGRIRNNTGQDLRMVFLVFHHPKPEGLAPSDHVLYVTRWKAGDQLLLDEEFRPYNEKGAPPVTAMTDWLSALSSPNPMRWKGEILPDRDRAGSGNWTILWFGKDLRTHNPWETPPFTEEDPLTPRLFPILSFYDRLPVARNPSGTEKRPDRFDLLRRGTRHLDMSSAISAGQIAIIGVSDKSDQPLPYNLEVDSRRVKGKGIVYYQFVVPLDHSEWNKPKPAETQPTTQKTQ